MKECTHSLSYWPIIEWVFSPIRSYGSTISISVGNTCVHFFTVWDLFPPQLHWKLSRNDRSIEHLELIDRSVQQKTRAWYDRWSNQSSSANAIGRRDHIETDCWPIKQSGDDGLQHSQSLKFRLLNYCFRRQQPTTALLRVTSVQWLALYRSVFWNYTIRWKKSGLGLGRPLFALAVDVASDEESGLQYLRLRHYEEKTFRFRLDIFQFLSVVNDHHEIFPTASESDDARIVKRAYHFQWLML